MEAEAKKGEEEEGEKDNKKKKERKMEMREETKGREGKWPSLKANQRNDSPLPAS